MGCRSGETPLELGEHFGSWLRAVPRHCLLSGQHREHHQQSGDDWDSHRNGDSDDSVPIHSTTLGVASGQVVEHGALFRCSWNLFHLF